MRHKRTSVWRLSAVQFLGAALALLLVAADGPLARLTIAVEPMPAGPGGAPLEFRRAYVPAAQIEKLAKGYLPLKFEEFERLLRRSQAAEVEPAGDAAAQHAEYTARFERQQLIVGEARLDIVNRTGETATIPFDSCRLAIGRATWDESPPRAATLALAADGKVTLVVEKSGSLKFPWTLRGVGDLLGGVAFDVHLPACGSSRFLLDLPEGLSPLVDRGVVIPPPAGVAETTADRLTWTIEVGGSTQFALRIVPERMLAKQPQLVLLRQASNYQLAPNGINLTADLRLDVYHQPLHRLTVQVASGLHVVSARYRDKPLPISATSGPAGTSQVVVEFPDPILGTDRQVQVMAVGPVVMGAPWRVPAVRVEGVVWQEGSITLATPEPLVLQDISTANCRQSKLGLLPAPSAGELLQFQSYSHDAAFEIQLDRRATRLKLLGATTLSFGAAAVAGTTMADFTVLQGEHYHLECDVTRLWVIDSVETEPANWLDDWSVLTADSRTQQIRMRLKKPLTARQPVRVVIRAHRQLPARGSPLVVEQLRLAEFKNLAETRTLIHLRAEPPHRLELTGDVGVNYVDSHELSPAEMGLIEGERTGLLFQDDSAAARLAVSLASELPRFSAETDVDALVDDDALTESYRFRCRPESSHVARLLAHFSSAREEDLVWTLTGEDERSVAPRRLSPPEQQQVGLTTGETWELVFLRPRNAPFELRASRSMRLLERTALSLASLPEADGQTGFLSIAAAEGAAPVLEATDLRPMPVRGSARERYSNVRAQFRYEPALGERVYVAPAPAHSRQSLAWAWKCELTSRVAVRKASHCARFLIENIGRGQVAFSLPPGAELEQVRVNEAEIPLPSVVGTERKLVVSLPHAMRFPVVTLTYSLPGVPRNLSPLHRLSPPSPTTDIPVLERTWTLWLPRELAVFEKSVAGQPRSAHFVPWGERLFGPLWNGCPTDPLALFSVSGWRESIVDGPRPTPQVKQVEQCLEQLGRLSSSSAVPQEAAVTWQELLSRYSRLPATADESPAPRLSIDQAGLAAAGVTPHSLIPTVNQPTSRDTGAALLAAANLRLQAVDDELQLTAAFASSSANESYSVSIEGWIASDRLPGSPWPSLPPAPHAGLADAGWQARTMELPQSGQFEISVYQPQLVDRAAWGLLFVTAFVVWWIAARRAIWLPLFAVALGLPALFADGLAQPLASKAFLGVLLGGLVLLAWRAGRLWRPRKQDASTQAMALPAGATMIGLLAALLLTATTVALFASRSSAADPPRVLTDSVTAKPYVVYIPVDDKRQPTTGYVYLPPALYEAIDSRAAADSGPARAWLVHSATYACQLERGPKPTVGALKATYDLEVLRPNSRVLLPLRRAGVHVYGDRARLNGQPAQVSWTSDGAGLVIDVDKPGKSQLELFLQPTVQSQDGVAGFDMGIPRLPRANFNVAMPLGVEGVYSPKSLGASTLDSKTGELQIDVGPADSLSLRWPEGTNAANPATEIDVEQLLWLKIRPGSVVVEGKFRFVSTTGPLPEVRLLVDPRLRLLPPRADQPIAQYRVREGEPHTIQLELKTTPASEAVLNLSFLLTGATGVGNIVVPRLEAVADRTGRKWLAVTVDPELDVDLPAAADRETVPTAEFARVWNKGVGLASTPEPLSVYRLPLAEAIGSIVTRPRRPRTEGAARVDISYGNDEAQMQFESDFSTSGGAVLQHRLFVPPGFEIESVSLKQGTVERLARWTRPNPTVAVIFPIAPVTGEQHLVVRGKFTRPSRGDWEIPGLVLADAQLPVNRIRLYRQPDVRVRLLASSRFRSDAAVNLGEYREGFGRLSAALVSAPADGISASAPLAAATSLGTVAVESNVAQAQCRMVTAMVRKGGVWQAEVECHVSVDDGILDALRFDVPSEWGGPWQVDPPAELSVTGLPGQSRRRLSVRPAAPIAGDFVLRMSGPLSPSPQGRIHAPEVVPLELGKVDRYLVVPTQVESQQIAWETSGLQAAPLPLEYRARFPAAESFASYQMIGSGFRATIKHIERLSGVPQVRLADIHVVWRTDGSCHGVALFDLESAGLRSCLIEVPPQLELVSAEAAGLPAILTPSARGVWRVELGPDQLPQRLSIAFRGGVPHGESPPRKLHFAAPLLQNISVDRTLWTIHSPADSSLGDRLPVGGQTDALEQELWRCESTAAVIERAAEVVSESSPQEIADWYAPWAGRFATSRRTLDVLTPRSREDSERLAAKIEALDGAQAVLAKRLSSGSPASPETAYADGREGLFERNQSEVRVTRCAFAAAQPTLEISYGPPPANDYLQRFIAAAGLIAGAVLAYLLAARGHLAEALARWPQACGVAAGICWWLWFSPSLLGWLVIAVSLASAFRSPWKGTRLRDEPHSSLSSGPRNARR